MTVDNFIYISYVIDSHFVSYLHKKTLDLTGATLIWRAETLSFDQGLHSSHHALNYEPIMTMRRNNTVGNGVYINNIVGFAWLYFVFVLDIIMVQ